MSDLTLTAGLVALIERSVGRRFATERDRIEIVTARPRDARVVDPPPGAKEAFRQHVVAHTRAAAYASVVRKRKRAVSDSMRKIEQQLLEELQRKSRTAYSYAMGTEHGRVEVALKPAKPRCPSTVLTLIEQRAALHITVREVLHDFEGVNPEAAFDPRVAARIASHPQFRGRVSAKFKEHFERACRRKEEEASRSAGGEAASASRVEVRVIGSK